MSEYLGLESMPEILHPASRQYRHNDGTPGLVPGFDFDETIAIVRRLQEQVEVLDAELRSTVEKLHAATEKNLSAVARIEALTAEVEEQARLLGMSGSRELERRV